MLLCSSTTFFTTRNTLYVEPIHSLNSFLSFLHSFTILGVYFLKMKFLLLSLCLSVSAAPIPSPVSPYRHLHALHSMPWRP